jgi:SAM-dependent methyltransferase
MPKDYFGGRVAAGYDASTADMFEPAVVDPIVDFLADLAGHGAALELGIGTGRIALPLAQRGIRVHSIDLSADGAACRNDPAGALERLEARAVYERQHQTRLRLGETGVAFPRVAG